MNIDEFITKVKNKISSVEEWDDYLQVMDYYYKQGVKSVLSDYKANDEDSEVFKHYDLLRKIFEDSRNYHLPKVLDEDKVFKKALRIIYDCSGDLIGKIEFKDSKGLNQEISTLRVKILVVKSEIARFLTIVALISIWSDVQNLNYKSEVFLKKDSNINSNN